MDIVSLKKIGQYKVIRFIDEGAFAWVFEVEDPKFQGRRLALKMLKPEAAGGEEFRRFEAEARLLAQIDHPSVVTIFDFGRDDEVGNFFYVMSFVDGPTLKQRLKEGPMTVEEAGPIFIDLLDGLAMLHEKSIIHRDIKPGNVLLGRDGRARLADLGIARVQTERGQTRTGVAVGTALYMSPEQARGRPVDARSDLFSLALTLYEALTGEVIYDHVDSIDSSSGMDVLMYIGSLVHTHTEFDVRFDESSTVPRPVQEVILKATRLKAEERFESATEMREALRLALREPPPAEVVQHGVSHHHLGLAGGGAAAILSLASLYFFYLAPTWEGQELSERCAADRVAGAALYEQALAAANAVKDFEDDVDPVLIEQVDDRILRADGYLMDADADMESGAFQLALKNLERGQRQNLAACQALVDGFLATESGARASAVEERGLALADAGAADVVPEAWAALAEQISVATQTERAGSACDVANADLVRLRAVEAAEPLADEVARQMAEVWPVLVEEARQKAITARLVASAVPAEDRVYRVALRDAKRLLLQGARHASSSEYLAARAAYENAEKSFITASLIAPAAVSRREAQALAEQVREESGTEELGEADALLAQGEAAFASEQWEEASAFFARAIDGAKELRAANEWRMAALEAQRGAVAARDGAIKEGAERSATIEFEQADVHLSAGEKALEAEDAKRAEQAFAKAQLKFEESQRRTIQALRDAEAKRVVASAAGTRLLGDRTCADFEAEEARMQCEKGQAALEAGTGHMSGLDAPQAKRQFILAQEAFARASSAQVLWEATRPLPPVLVRRMPQRPVVRIPARQLQPFAIEASDPNGDLLSYTWTIDEEVQAEDGPTLKRRLERGAEVKVKVDDGRGGQFVESWTVEVVDREGEAG